MLCDVMVDPLAWQWYFGSHRPSLYNGTVEDSLLLTFRGGTLNRIVVSLHSDVKRGLGRNYGRTPLLVGGQVQTNNVS